MTPFFRALRAAVVLGTTTATSVAQLVWPAAYSTAPGNAVLNAPFTVGSGHPTTSTKFMVVIDPATLPFGTGTVLSQLSMRRDASYTTTPYAASTGALRVRIGRTLVGPDLVQDVRFHRLWDGVPTQVFNATSSTPFTVPAGPAPGASLPPFNLVIPFTTTFTWSGGPLGIEITWTPTSGSSAWRLDGFMVPESTPGTFRTLGPGCPGSHGFSAFQYALPETNRPGTLLTIQAEGGVRGTTPSLQDWAVHTIGLSNTLWGTIPLPVDLQGPLGMPAGCLLRVDPLVITPVPVTNPSVLFTRAVVQYVMPNQPHIAGGQLYSQWVFLDLGINAPFQGTISDGIEITLGSLAPPAAPRTARTIWKYGAQPTVNETDSGRMVPTGYGPILKFN